MRVIKSKNLVIRTLFSLLIPILFSCESSSTDPIPDSAERGALVEYGKIVQYSALTVQALISTSGIDLPYSPAFSVEVIKLIYGSIDHDGNIINLSGAFIHPIGGKDSPIISIQHGTVTKRDFVASVQPLNTSEGIAGIYAASLGYLVVLPYYPGFGISNKIHPYVHDESVAYSVIDNIRAVKSYIKSKGLSTNNKLFLTGYSEGGYATLAARREIENNHQTEFNLIAVAPMSGPYNLKKTFGLILEQEEYNAPAYIGFFFTAYNDVYGWNNLTSIFKSPYAELMSSLFDGTHTFSEINSQLPSTITDFVLGSFISNYKNGTAIEIISVLEENSLLNWRPSVPLRFYHGDLDQTVPYENSTSIIDNLISNGATDIELITISGGNHESSGLPAVFDMLEWFNSIQNNILIAKLN
jgi:pimeloyl-ACP methyl ester carboxylesterase